MNCEQIIFELIKISLIIIGFIATIYSIYKNNKINKAENLCKIYKLLYEEDIIKFLDLIEDSFNGKKLNLTDGKNKIALEKILSLIDEIYYLKLQGVISIKEMEFIAYEIILLSKNKYVTDYIIEYHSKIDKSMEEFKSIFPFTGLKSFIEKEDFENEIKKILK